jgi:hypothetical protein
VPPAILGIGHHQIAAVSVQGSKPKRARISSKGLAWAWVATNLGVALFCAGLIAPNIDPVCSGSPWSILSWVFAALALGGLVLASVGTVLVVRQRLSRVLPMWIVALALSFVQVTFAGLAVHMATVPRIPGVVLL